MASKEITSNKTTIILLSIIAVGLLSLNIVCWLGNKKKDFTYDYDYVGVDKKTPRCNCQGSGVVPVKGGNVRFMIQSPLNPGVGI